MRQLTAEWVAAWEEAKDRVSPRRSVERVLFEVPCPNNGPPDVARLVVGMRANGRVETSFYSYPPNWLTDDTDKSRIDVRKNIEANLERQAAYYVVAVLPRLAAHCQKKQEEFRQFLEKLTEDDGIEEEEPGEY